jgi:hydroxymethylglutaryl-CoA lyase
VKRFPQFADNAAVLADAAAIPGLTVSALTPNARGAMDALAAGVRKLSFTLSASRRHSLANVRKTPEEQLLEFRRLIEVRDSQGGHAHVTGGLSTAFGCTLEGRISESTVCELAAGLVAAGADDVSLADTVGYASPGDIRRVVMAVRREIGDKLSALHLHDTRGLGLANVMAGSGVRHQGVRCLAWRTRRLSLCPGSVGQHLHRGSGVHAGRDGPEHRHRSAGSPRGPSHGREALAGGGVSWCPRQGRLAAALGRATATHARKTGTP